MSEVSYGSRDIKHLIKRAEGRSHDFKELMSDLPKGLVACDIGANDGIISRQLAKDFEFSEMNMYDPYVDDRGADIEEYPQNVCHFYKSEFV